MQINYLTALHDVIVKNLPPVPASAAIACAQHVASEIMVCAPTRSDPYPGVARILLETLPAVAPESSYDLVALLAIDFDQQWTNQR